MEFDATTSDKPKTEFGATMAAATFSFRAHRIFTVPFRMAGVTKNTMALVSLTEVFRDGNTIDKPGIGGATMKVYNVAPHDGVVEVRGEIDWDDDLDIRATIVTF